MAVVRLPFTIPLLMLGLCLVILILTSKEIVGVRGNAIELNNFPDKSGFNEVEGSLMFDGVDDYGIWEGKPLLTDFTIICKRLIVGRGYVISCVDSNKWGGAFRLESISDRYSVRCFGDTTRTFQSKKG